MSAIGDDGAEPPQNPISLSVGSSAVPALLVPLPPSSLTIGVGLYARGRAAVECGFGWSGHDTGICRECLLLWLGRAGVAPTELENLPSSLSPALLLSALPVSLWE